MGAADSAAGRPGSPSRSGVGRSPGASFAKRLLLPVSNDTLLRVVRRRGSPQVPRPTVIGIDDWAWRRNHRYGTIICDLERRRPICLLPDREAATAQAWLSQQPQIAIVARDRGGAYALAASRALPHAVQVADRWHLMENASHGRASLMASFANGVDRDINAVRAAITSGWSNGQTEGQITKLKLVKRQMYGRGKLDLLQARLIGATP